MYIRPAAGPLGTVVANFTLSSVVGLKPARIFTNKESTKSTISHFQTQPVANKVDNGCKFHTFPPLHCDALSKKFQKDFLYFEMVHFRAGQSSWLRLVFTLTKWNQNS